MLFLIIAHSLTYLLAYYMHRHKHIFVCTYFGCIHCAMVTNAIKFSVDHS